MISADEQLDLFDLIAKYLERNVRCYAFGGTAMLFYGFKEITNDIDLLFETEAERRAFIHAITQLGYKQSSLRMYPANKAKDQHAPLMYTRGEERFDLFTCKIFRTVLSPRMKEDKFAVHEFRKKKTLTLMVLRKEHLVLLKAITSRATDAADILQIVQRDARFDWEYLIGEALWQHAHGDSFVLLDLEDAMQALKEHTFIKKNHFARLSAAQEKQR